MNTQGNLHASHVALALGESDHQPHRPVSHLSEFFLCLEDTLNPFVLLAFFFFFFCILSGPSIRLISFVLLLAYLGRFWLY
jgi:hypothetical protein